MNSYSPNWPSYRPEQGTLHRPVRLQILKEQGDVPAFVVHGSGSDVQIRLPGGTPLSHEERALYFHHGNHPGTLQLLLSLDETTRTPTCIDAFGRIRAIHTTSGRATLREFLVAVLGMHSINREMEVAGAGGWFYWLEPEPAPAQAEPDQPEAPSPPGGGAFERPDERRRDPRVPVRVKVRWRLQNMVKKGRAYNISRRGVFIVSDTPIPRLGEQVRVTYPVTIHIKTVTIQLVGRVCWTSNGNHSTTGHHGFGIAIEGFGDPVDERVWEQYVDNEVTFSRSTLRIHSSEAN